MPKNFARDFRGPRARVFFYLLFAKMSTELFFIHSQYIARSNSYVPKNLLINSIRNFMLVDDAARRCLYCGGCPRCLSTG